MLYVTKKEITLSRPPLSVAVRATSGVSSGGHFLAAKRVQQMLFNASDLLFARLQQSDLGVFAWNERGWGTQFPEFAHLADRPECVGSMRCAGPCAQTCTPDGRKWASIAGMATARLAVVLEDNVLCSNNDPYRKAFSVLVHEFGHTIKMGGLRGTPLLQRVCPQLTALANVQYQNVRVCHSELRNDRECGGLAVLLSFTNSHCHMSTF